MSPFTLPPYYGGMTKEVFLTYYCLLFAFILMNTLYLSFLIIRLKWKMEEREKRDDVPTLEEYNPSREIKRRKL